MQRTEKRRVRRLDGHEKIVTVTRRAVDEPAERARVLDELEAYLPLARSNELTASELRQYAYQKRELSSLFSVTDMSKPPSVSGVQVLEALVQEVNMLRRRVEQLESKAPAAQLQTPQQFFEKLEEEEREESGDDTRLLATAKNLLQEYCMKHGYGLPVYVRAKTTGPDHARSFVCAVQVCGEIFEGVAQGRVADAEKSAAVVALKRLAIVV